MNGWTIEKVLAAATLLALFVGAVSTWAIAFSRIGDLEKRVDVLETTLGTKLIGIDRGIDRLNWQWETMTKQLEKKR